MSLSRRTGLGLIAILGGVEVASHFVLAEIVPDARALAGVVAAVDTSIVGVVLAIVLSRRADAARGEAAQKDQALEAARVEKAEQDRALAEQDRALAEQERALAEKERALAEKERALAEKERALATAERALAEKDGLIAAERAECDRARPLAMIVSDTSVGVLVVERDAADLRVRYANAALLAMCGLDSAAVEGRNVSQLLSANETDAWALRQPAPHGPTKLEVSLLTPGGAEGSFWCACTINPLASPDGRTERYTLLLVDISARKKVEARLRATAMVMDLAPEGITIADSQGNIVAVNPSFTRLTGYTSEEVVGKNPRILQSGRHDRAFYEAMWSAISAKGLWEGEIWNRRKNGEVYLEWVSIVASKDREGKPERYVAMFSDITARKAAEERLHRLATHDALTGLPNRALVVDRIEWAIADAKRRREKVGLLFIDLDRFKPINDTLGHQVGDQVLREIAGRLGRSLRVYDTAFRVGGDEFVVVLCGVQREADAFVVGEKLLATIAEPLTVDGQPCTVGASIGIALYPDHGDSYEALVRVADGAMYRAKSVGRNNCQLGPGPREDAEVPPSETLSSPWATGWRVS